MPRMFVVAFAVTAVVFLILDAIWLGVIARNLYQREIRDLLLPKPNFGAAAISEHTRQLRPRTRVPSCRQHRVA